MADGWCGSVWVVAGDHDYKRDCLELANVNAGECCSHCPASNKKVPWFHFSAGAKWVKAIFTERMLLCVLFQNMVGLGILSVYPDWMHDKHLGTDKVPQKGSYLPHWMFHLFCVFYIRVFYLCKSICLLN